MRSIAIQRTALDYRGWPVGLEGEDRTKKSLHSSFAISYPNKAGGKSGIAACGMRRVKCGMECAESYCGTVGNNVLRINSLRYAGLQ